MPKMVRTIGMVPAKDYERATRWYADKLGLKPVYEFGDQGAIYELGQTRFMLYPSEFAGTNKANAIAFEVEDVEATVSELREAGVGFMDYDSPGFKTVDGIATMEDGGRTMKTAWCTDSEANIIVISDSWGD